jgi:hypothetical protein
MSFQTFVTERLAAITAQLNAITTNAKKIDELPVQSNLDPASKLHVSRGGISESLEVQKIISAVNAGSYDQLLSIGEIALVANVATIPANAQWKINEVNYGNIAEIVITIPYCATGLERKDILVANTSNDIVLVQGLETTGITIRPNIPINTVLVTEMDVTDSSVGTPSDPITGDIYIKKIERQKVIIPDDVLSFTLNDERHFVEFTNDEQGDFRYFILGANYVSGQNHPLRIRNNTGHAFTLMHLYPSGASLPGETVLFFPNEDNFILGDKEIIEFVYDTDSNRFEFFGVITDLIEEKELAYALSDETTNLTVGNLISFRMPFAMILSEVRLSVNDAPTVSSLIVNVKEGGVSIFSTLLSIDAGELTSVTAAVPAVISDANMADDALITVSTTQIGSGNTGKGLKILFKGKKA